MNCFPLLIEIPFRALQAILAIPGAGGFLSLLNAKSAHRLTGTDRGVRAIAARERKDACQPATGAPPNDNLEPTTKLPKCYQMLPSLGSISKLRVATNSGEDVVRV